MKRIVALLLILSLMIFPAAASSAEGFTDVPKSHWAYSDILQARAYGLFNGRSSTEFGLGGSLSRADFAVLLCRMFSWNPFEPEAPSFSDCTSTDWRFPYVEAALAHGALEASDSFRPNDSVTREEMSIMLVRALGYTRLAESGYEFDLPFPDVTENIGYAALAWQFGLVQGSLEHGQLLFKPDAPAKREEVAVMLLRVYKRYIAKIDWLHGFYAFSSYSQIGLTNNMDAVSLGWARLSLDENGDPWVNTTAKNNNEWNIPAQSFLALEHFDTNGTSYNLNVFCDEPSVLATVESRAATVSAIASMAGGYAGITMDFETLRAADKQNYNAFISALRNALPEEKLLYVCVHPVVPDDAYYDGYDFKYLGELCDKVILMAHDYHYTEVPASLLGSAWTESPLTPFHKIYYALAAITDPETGVADRSKIALAISFNSVAWQVNSSGKLVSRTSYSPISSTIVTRLRQEDTLMGWSETHRNPYLYYTTENGARYRLWYEDARSVMDKIELARMFGITGVSLWRLGNIPAYDDKGLEYDVWSAIQADR